MPLNVALSAPCPNGLASTILSEPCKSPFRRATHSLMKSAIMSVFLSRWCLLIQAANKRVPLEPAREGLWYCRRVGYQPKAASITDNRSPCPIRKSHTHHRRSCSQRACCFPSPAIPRTEQRVTRLVQRACSPHLGINLWRPPLTCTRGPFFLSARRATESRTVTPER